MEQSFHAMTALFEQLGLPAGERDIEAFIANHPIAGNTPLHEADFWTPQQAAFLRSALGEDADWAEVVDHLSVQLRE